MEDDLKRIVTTVLGTIVFMFLALSAIAVLSSGRIGIPNATVELTEKEESMLRDLPTGIESKALGEETLAAVTNQ